MGNAISRSLGLRDGGPSTIDGGTTRLKSDTDPVVPGTRRRKIEYDISIVEKMIKNRRLAPFFQDLSESAEEEKDLNTSEVTDPSGGVGSNCELPDNNHEVRVKDAKSSIFNENLDNVDDEEYGGVGSFDSRGNLNSGPVLLKSENSLRTIEEPAVREKIGKGRKKGKKEMKLEKASQVEAMVKNFVRIRNAECPICFIEFPENINRTVCCRQPLCTRCFISIRKPPSGRIISCPFCNKRDLGVSYVPPLTFIEAKACGQVDTAIANKTVRCESIRAYVYLPASSYPNQRRTNYYHYPANSQVRNHTVMGQGGGGGLSGNGGRVPINRFVPYTGPAFTVRYGDRTTRYGRGTLVMYNERGVPIYLPPGSGEVYTARHAATRLATDVFNN